MLLHINPTSPFYYAVHQVCFMLMWSDILQYSVTDYFLCTRLLVWVGLAGICWMHFSVCVLLYAFLLLMLPDTRGASLEEVLLYLLYVYSICT